MILLLIFILIIIVITAKKKGSGEIAEPLEQLVCRDTIEYGLKYPYFCFSSVPVFNTELPDYPEENKKYFKFNILDNVVYNSYRKNLLFSGPRSAAISLFRFVNKFKINKLIVLANQPNTIKILDYLLSHINLQIVLFSIKFNPEQITNNKIKFFKKNFTVEDCKDYIGWPIFGTVLYIYKNYSHKRIYSTVRYNTKFITELHLALKPKFALWRLNTYGADVNYEIPEGRILISPFQRMTTNPGYLVECVHTTKLQQVNMMDIFCRIHLFNVCSRNLNYSNTPEYKTYDTYMEKKYLPSNYREIIGPDPLITEKILSETLPCYYTEKNYLSPILISNETVEGSVYNGFADESTIMLLPNDKLEITEKKGIYYLNIRNTEIFRLCFENLKVAFFNDNPDNGYLVRYLGEVYFTKQFRKKVLYKHEQVEDYEEAKRKATGILLKYPYSYEPAFRNGAKNFIIPKEKYATLWIESCPGVEFMIDFFHYIMPETLMAVIGSCEPRYYAINYEPIENWKKLFVEKHDLVITAV